MVWKEKVSIFDKELKDLIEAVQLERETWAQESAKTSSNQGQTTSEKSPEDNLIRFKENSGHVKLLL